MEEIFRGLLILVFLFLLSIALPGQQFSITQPGITTCSGVLEDSGGPSGPYGNNEDFVCTICPTEIDSTITLEFVVFNLSTLGPAPADLLQIFDGNSTSAPFLGDFMGTSLLSNAISGTPTNTSGCLTLRFRSNTFGTGNFAAVISCGPPCPFPCDQNCPEPIAQLMGVGGSSSFCSGAEIQVDGSSSYGAGDATISSFIWSLNGATIDTTSTPDFDIQTALPGAQVIRLRVVDDEGCVSKWSDPLQLLTGADATITFTDLPAIACTGSTVTFQANTSLPSLEIPVGDCLYYGNGLHLPDASGPGYTGTIFHQSAEPGSMVSDLTDIPDICVSMEHSYMGDLVIQISCPTGQTVTLHEQGGGSTYLGAAYDLDNDLFPVPGECWNYCWSAQSTSGTWLEAVMAGNTIPAGIPPSPALLPGTYESSQSMTGLYGCPKNGSWTFTIYDLWAADNGFICNWCVGLGQEVVYTNVGPIAGTTPDSAFWTGDGIVNDLTDGGLASVTFNEPGGSTLSFSMTDSYGCVHDTTVVIPVHDIAVDAGPSIQICNGPEFLEGSLESPQDACSLTLVLYDSFGDSWNGGSQLEVVIGGSPTSYSIDISGITTLTLPIATGHGQDVQLIYTPGGVFNDENSFELYDPSGELLYASGPDPDAGAHFDEVIFCWPAEISWTPASGLSDPNALSPAVLTTTSGWYTLTHSIPGPAGCSVSDSVWVDAPDTIEPDLTLDPITQTICTEADGAVSFEWYLGGDLHASTTVPCIENAPFGTWQVVAIPELGCISVSVDTLFCPGITITENSGLLLVKNGTGSFAWFYEGGSIPDATGPVVEISAGGEYTVVMTTDYGCILNASIVVAGGMGQPSLARDMAIRVFPNPNNGRFQLDALGVGGPVILKVMDIPGRTMFSANAVATGGTTTMVVDIDLPAGTYLVQFTDTASSHILRIVVQ